MKKLTEAGVGAVAVGVTVVLALAGAGIKMWADVRENTHAIAELKAHDERQDEQRDEGRQRITDFLREYERKESEDNAVNKDVEQLHRDVQELSNLLNELRILIATERRDG